MTHFKHQYKFRAFFFPILFVSLLVALAACTPPRQPSFRMVVDPSLADTLLTGRLFLLLHPDTTQLPLESQGWLEKSPIFASDVVVWKPGETYIFSKIPMGYPHRFDSLQSGYYAIQALLDVAKDYPNPFRAPGNFFSTKTTGYIRVGDDTQEFSIVLDQILPPRPFPESPLAREVVWKSPLLSAFHGRDILMKAAVLLPESYAANPSARYPVVYVIPGFGGTHERYERIRQNYFRADATDKIVVYLNPECYHGHHTFANSENNGPWGDALVKELIPHIDTSFPTLGLPGARFVAGHSSGGWSSLWLQIQYPEAFGGVWSTAPDPVDFRDFSGINLYQDSSLFMKGKEVRPLVRRNGEAVLSVIDFWRREQVMGHGGQLQSFEAVFGKRGANGKPVPLWNHQTGVIDPRQALQWKKYDIVAQLKQNWPELKDKLAGKIHVYMGEEDNFYLEGAVRLLQQEMAALGSDAVIELFPGKDHGTLLNDALLDRIAREMDSQLAKNQVTATLSNP
jgi:S-formylglutathione hydrolase FrmB